MIGRLLVALVILVLGAAPAIADKPRVAVTGDPAIAKAVRDAIGGKVELVNVGKSAASPAALAEQHRLNAVIVVTATAKVATCAVHQGLDGRVLDSFDAKVSKKLMPRRIATQVWKQLGDTITGAQAPPAKAAPAVATTPTKGAPAPTKGAPAPTKGAPAIATAPTKPGPGATAAPTTFAPDSTATAEPASATRPVSAAATDDDSGLVARASTTRREPRTVTIAVEERPFWRRLRYNDDIDERLRPSDLAANAVAISASWRPLAKARGLELSLRGERAVGVNGSRTTDGTELQTSTSEWAIGAGYDVGIKSMRVGLAVSYGEHRFAVDDAMQPAELLPDTTYRFFRGGLATSIPLTPRLDLSITGGWRQLLGMGDLTTDAWFPRATGNGIDAGAGITFHAARWLAFHARVDVRRYFFAMNPEPGDTWIAGGATDQYFGGAIGAAISPR